MCVARCPALASPRARQSTWESHALKDADPVRGKRARSGRAAAGTTAAMSVTRPCRTARVHAARDRPPVVLLLGQIRTQSKQPAGLPLENYLFQRPQ